MARRFVLMFLLLGGSSCRPPATAFDAVEQADLYAAKQLHQAPPLGDTLKIMTWNIRFGARRINWFGDCCGDRVLLSKAETLAGLEEIAALIRELQPDVLFLQEVDVGSKRSSYIDQMQWLLDHTDLNYGVYASNWQVQFIPSHGLGRIDEGNAILSRWPLTQPKRIALALRGDLDALTRYFYVRNNIVEALLEDKDGKALALLCTHFEAFSTDDTKRRHVEQTLAELRRLDAARMPFVIGGDFNLLPPGSDSTDFCDEDRCPGEHFHGTGDQPFHKEGSNYTPEIDWLTPFYEAYSPETPLADYLADQPRFFTHTTVHPYGPWNRKLDYLFTNGRFVPGSAETRQQAVTESDHCPVTVLYIRE